MDSTHLFSRNKISSNDRPEWKSREKLVSMNIDTFLTLAKAGFYEPKLRAVQEIIRRGDEISELPYLIAYETDEEATFAVDGHEGRHRAMALKRMGYKTMPVLLRTSIRWSEQDDPQKFDYKAVWPKQLINEDGNARLRFPVTRDQATQSYSESLGLTPLSNEQKSPTPGP